MTMKWESDLLIKSMTTDRTGDTKSYYQFMIINITLSEDLRKDEKLVKNLEKILHVMISFKSWVFET